MKWGVGLELESSEYSRSFVPLTLVKYVIRLWDGACGLEEAAAEKCES